MTTKKLVRQMLKKNEFYLLITFIIICIGIQIISGGQLFVSSTILNILRAMVILGMFALVNLMVVISGGFDLSFAALAALAYSSTTAILLGMGWGAESVWSAFLIAGTLGMIIGMLNGLLVGKFGLNAMIVTLGTQTLFLGISLGVFQFPEVTSTLPRGLVNFGEMYIFEVFGPTGIRTTLTIAIIPFILLAILVWFILNHTMFGRSLYAIGGNEASAQRAGINVVRTKFILYMFVGLTAGLTGMLRVAMARQSIPMGLIGWDLRVIPAVILGGASIFGGVGSVFGTLIAVALISVVTNSLLLMGISTFWQDFFYGLIIIIGVTVSAVRVKRKGA